MSVPFKIKKATPFPDTIFQHAAFTWKDNIFVWGGRSGRVLNSYNDRSVVYMYHQGEWIRKQTTGDVPQGYHSAASQVTNDRLFVVDLDRISALDLNTWTWSRFFPSGIQLSSQSSGVQSWVHNGKIYLLDDWFDDIYMHLCCYNVEDNSLEWTDHEGDIPDFEYGRKAILHGDTVILLSDKANALYTLDITSMRWKKAYEDLPSAVAPRRFQRCTFTKISQSTAVLFGAYEDTSGIFHDDCGLLNLDNVVQFKDSSTIWKKFPCRFLRVSHGAVWDRGGQELWVIGGSNGKNWVSDVLRVSFKLPTLKTLALDYAARNICKSDPRLSDDQLPVQVRNELVEYKSDFGVDWLTHILHGCVPSGKCKCKLLVQRKKEVP